MTEPSNPREAALQDFLKRLRIALNFITLYSKDHKSFIAAIADLRIQTDFLLSSASSIAIAVSVDSLSIDGVPFEKKQLYLDLARHFHFRKIKSLQINQGVTLEELSFFLETICLPVKEIFKRGGVQLLLSAAGVMSIQVEELDYSSLLRDEGGVDADVGAFLLNQSVQSQDPARIKAFSTHFEKAIAHINIENIVEDAQLGANLHNFLAYLRTSDEAAFQHCVQSLFRVVLKDTAAATAEQMLAFASFVQGLSADTIAALIVAEASSNDDFNNSNLAFFLQALDAHSHDAIRASLAQSITEGGASSRMSPKASRKLKDLFTVSDAPLVAGIYERVMATLSSNIPAEAAVTFDREQALRNYRSILISMLKLESDPGDIDDIAHRICAEWKEIAGEPRGDHFQVLSAALSAYRGHEPVPPSLMQLDKMYRRFVEDAAWQDEVPGWQEALIEDLDQSTRDAGWYLGRIFDSDIIYRRGIQLFLRFFPEQTGSFCEHLARISGDLEFIGAMVEALRQIRSPGVISVLENIYGFSNELIQLEVLRAMHDVPECDDAFLLPILSQADYPLRKEAAAVLVSDDRTRQAAIELLLGGGDIWGKNNGLIVENINIIEDLRVLDAAAHLARLSRKPFFWNIKVRRSARKALEAFA
jgi:hypothetical protein